MYKARTKSAGQKITHHPKLYKQFTVQIRNTVFNYTDALLIKFNNYAMETARLVLGVNILVFEVQIWWFGFRPMVVDRHP